LCQVKIRELKVNTGRKAGNLDSVFYAAGDDGIQSDTWLTLGASWMELNMHI